MSESEARKIMAAALAKGLAHVPNGGETRGRKRKLTDAQRRANRNQVCRNWRAKFVAQGLTTHGKVPDPNRIARPELSGLSYSEYRRRYYQLVTKPARRESSAKLNRDAKGRLVTQGIFKGGK